MLLEILRQLTKRQQTRVCRKLRRQQLHFELLEVRRYLSVNVPEFSSLPGADHTIFLDFDGQVVQDTSWNGYYNQATLVAPAYNIDADPTSFDSAELARIEEAWNRIAEDFRPFNVNVTTVDPGTEALRLSGSGDSQWGIRVIMTNEANMVTDPAERTGAGGIAYIDSFNWSTDTPVWVYTTGGKSIAEAGSHEVGHSLGLSHDGLNSGTTYYSGHGSGETGWASIMGVGYYQNVTQWDQGEYFDSNNGGSGANYGNGPDDLAVIVGGNGFGYRADDHGNTNATSSILGLTGTTVADTGLIETTADLDVFSFTTGAGLVTLGITPFTPGPNLDIKAELFDAGGSLVATSNSTAVTDAAFSLNLAAGQYFLHIDGTGWGTPGSSSPSGYSDYGSLGQYAISGSIVDTGGLPTLNIGDASAIENSGQLTFELSLSEPSDGNISVTYQSVDGSAIAGLDYLVSEGTVTFLSGDQTKSVTVNLIDDATFENTETMFVNLVSATGAVIVDNQGVGTITDEDPATLPTVSISDASVGEGKAYTKGNRAGTSQLTEMQFTVTLSAASNQTISVDFATVDGTATLLDNDYQSAAGTVTFNPGETSRTISVTIVGDNRFEGDEAFEVNLETSFNAIILDGTGTGTIVGDDSGRGGGGGNGGGRGNKLLSELDPIAVEDAHWLFEGPGTTFEDPHDFHEWAYESVTSESSFSALELYVGVDTATQGFNVANAAPAHHRSQQQAFDEEFELAGALELNTDDLIDLADLDSGATQAGTRAPFRFYETEGASDVLAEDSLNLLHDKLFEQWGIQMPITR